MTSVICPYEAPVNINGYIIQELNKNSLDGQLGVNIAFLESSYKLDSYHLNSNGSNDLGVWQINSIHGIGDKCRLDLACSTKWFVDKVKSDGNWNAWIAYKRLK